MKKSRVFTLLTAVVALLSCAKESSETAKLPTPTVSPVVAKCTETSVFASWAAIYGAASYNVRFDNLDVVTTTETEMEWDGLEQSSTHTVKVQAVSADKSKFSDSDWSEVVILSTEDSQPEQQTSPFNILISDVTFYNAAFKVETGEFTGDYFFTFTPKVLFDRDYSGDVDQFAAGFIEQVKQLAQQSEKTFGDMHLILKYTGELIGDLPGLAPETEYIAVAFGVDIDGNMTTGVASAVFKTEVDPGYQKSDMKFGIKTAVNGKSATIQVTPTKDDEYYFYAAFNKSNLSTVIGGDSDEAILNYYIRLFDQHLADQTYEEFAAKNFTKGADSYTYNGLEDNSDYVAIAFGVTLHGGMCVATTDLARSEFQTGAGSEKPGEENIDIILKKKTSVEFEADFVPSDGNRDYVWDYLDYSDYRALTDEEIIAKVIAYRSVNGYFWMTTSKGTMNVRNTNELVSGHEYILLAFYVKENPENKYSALADSKLFKTIFVASDEGGETPQPGLTFTISEDEVTENSLKSTITPSDNAAKYIAYVVEASKYEGKSDNDIIKGVISSLSYDIYNAAKTGVCMVSKDGLEAETDYYVVAFGADDNFNANSTLTKRLITTKSSSVAPAEGIAITVKECTPTKIDADVDSADKNMELCVNLYRTETLDGLTDDEIISRMLEDAGYELYYGLPKGHVDLIRDAVSDNTEYVIVACGVKNTSACTELYKKVVTTPAE